MKSNLAASERRVLSSRFDDLHRILALYLRESIRGKESSRASAHPLHTVQIRHGRDGDLERWKRTNLHAFATVQLQSPSMSALCLTPWDIPL